MPAGCAGRGLPVMRNPLSSVFRGTPVRSIDKKFSNLREALMKTGIFVALSLASVLAAGGAAAQPAPFNATGDDLQALVRKIEAEGIKLAQLTDL